MLNFIFDYFIPIIPIITSVGTLLGILINLKQNPNRRLSKISTEYKLLKEIKKDFIEGETSFAYLEFQKIIKYNIPYEEFEFILLDKNFSTYFKCLKNGHIFLNFNKEKMSYTMKRKKLHEILSAICVALTSLPLIFYVAFYDSLYKTNLHDLLYAKRILLVAIFFLPFFLISAIYSINSGSACMISKIKKEQNK